MEERNMMGMGVELELIFLVRVNKLNIIILFPSLVMLLTLSTSRVMVILKVNVGQM
jgi:hypothetical protein